MGAAFNPRIAKVTIAFDEGEVLELNAIVDWSYKMSARENVIDVTHLGDNGWQRMAPSFMEPTITFRCTSHGMQRYRVLDSIQDQLASVLAAIKQRDNLIGGEE